MYWVIWYQQQQVIPDWTWERVVSCFFLHSYEFRVFLLLDWMPPKYREPILPYYLPYSRGENWWLYDLPKGMCAKVNITHSPLISAQNSTFHTNNCTSENISPNKEKQNITLNAWHLNKCTNRNEKKIIKICHFKSISNNLWLIP